MQENMLLNYSHLKTFEEQTNIILIQTAFAYHNINYNHTLFHSQNNFFLFFLMRNLINSLPKGINYFFQQKSKQKKEVGGSRSMPKGVDSHENKCKKDYHLIQKEQYIKLCQLEFSIREKCKKREEIHRRREEELVVRSTHQVLEDRSERSVHLIESMWREERIISKHLPQLDRILSVCESQNQGEPEHVEESKELKQVISNKEIKLLERLSTLASETNGEPPQSDLELLQ